MLNGIKLVKKGGSGWGTLCMTGEHLGQNYENFAFFGNIPPKSLCDWGALWMDGELFGSTLI